MTALEKVRWGIIGPGGVAKAFAGGIAHAKHATLEAIGTRHPERAGYANDFPGARVIAGYEALIADPDVDAIYIATPHVNHAALAIQAAEAGKHVLCEKPMALTAFEADAIMHAARKADTFLGEGYMYRFHPQTKRILELVESGRIGSVCLIRSSMGYAKPDTSPDHRLYANDLAGGGILDLGGYPVSMARLIAGAAASCSVSEPSSVSGMAHLGPTGVDEWASALLTFPGGIIAEVSCSISVDQDNVLRIFGTEGRIEVTDFWFASGVQGGTGTINIVTGDHVETIQLHESGWLYAFEVDAASEAILAGRKEFSWPGPDWTDSLATLRVLDKWRAAVGLEYGIEKADKRTMTLSGRPIHRNGSRIPKKDLPGISGPASILALGFDTFFTFSSGSILLDAYFEAGGNLFDTAHKYLNGYTEKLFGEWQRSRGVRNETLIIGKGAHTPDCTPEAIGSQLAQSLDRLQTDHVDVYFMHRDNPEVPVGEFVDAMDAEVKAGRIRGIFGGSNWSRERMDAAVKYAAESGKQAPAALSNNFSLANLVWPIWDGCIACSDEVWRPWLVERQMPNFAWSSQSRGFFTDRAGRDRLDNQEMVRAWYSEENFGRRGRAIELADRLGKSAHHVALAYVLAQPFPSIPLIGPRTLSELDDSLSALDIQLSLTDLTWLESGVR